jgi:hypothetical protein
MKRGIHFTEPLPSNDRRDTYTDTDRSEEFMKYAAEMGSSAMIYIPSFIKIGSGIQKLRGGGFTDTQTSRKSHKATFIFSK